MKGFIRIGNTKKAHGIHGEIRIAIEDRYFEDFTKASAVFLDIGGELLPFFTESLKDEANILIKFEGINDRAAAVEVTGKEVYLRETDILTDDEREFEVVDEGPEYAFLEGYLIRDENAGEIGMVREVRELPQQEMAVVDYRGKEILIPLNEIFIKTISDVEKSVIMELPEGLLDL